MKKYFVKRTYLLVYCYSTFSTNCTCSLSKHRTGMYHKSFNHIFPKSQKWYLSIYCTSPWAKEHECKMERTDRKIFEWNHSL